MKGSPQPSPLELQLLSVLWANGPATVRQVLENIPDGRARAYTTALSMLQGMEVKGLVSRNTRGKAHIYKAKKSEQEILVPLLRGLTANVFGGSAGKLIEVALGAVRLSESEKKGVQAALDAHQPKADPKK